MKISLDEALEKSGFPNSDFVKGQCYIAIQQAYIYCDGNEPALMKFLINLAHQVIKDFKGGFPKQDEVGLVAGEDENHVIVANLKLLDGQDVDDNQNKSAIQPNGSDGGDPIVPKNDGHTEGATITTIPKDPTDHQISRSRERRKLMAKSIFEQIRLGGKALSQIYGYELRSFVRDGHLANELLLEVEKKGCNINMELPISMLLTEDEVKSCVSRIRNSSKDVA